MAIEARSTKVVPTDEQAATPTADATTTATTGHLSESAADAQAAHAHEQTAIKAYREAYDAERAEAFVDALSPAVRRAVRDADTEDRATCMTLAHDPVYSVWTNETVCSEVIRGYGIRTVRLDEEAGMNHVVFEEVDADMDAGVGAGNC